MKMNKNRAEELLVPLKKGTAEGISKPWAERLIEALEYVIENESTKESFYLDKDFVRLYNAVADIVNFCWGDDGWIGTENIRKSGKFLEMMGEVGTSILPFVPKSEENEELD